MNGPLRERNSASQSFGGACSPERRTVFNVDGEEFGVCRHVEEPFAIGTPAGIAGGGGDDPFGWVDTAVTAHVLGERTDDQFLPARPGGAVSFDATRFLNFQAPFSRTNVSS